MRETGWWKEGAFLAGARNWVEMRARDYNYLPGYPSRFLPVFLLTCIPSYPSRFLPVFLLTCIPSYPSRFLPVFLLTCIPSYPSRFLPIPISHGKSWLSPDVALPLQVLLPPTSPPYFHLLALTKPKPAATPLSLNLTPDLSMALTPDSPPPRTSPGSPW